MSYDSQRGGISGAPDPFAVPEVQLDCDGTGGNSSLPGGQGQDQPLLDVGTYTRPDCALPNVMDADQQNVKKAGGTSGASMPVWLA